MQIDPQDYCFQWTRVLRPIQERNRVESLFSISPTTPTPVFASSLYFTPSVLTERLEHSDYCGTRRLVWGRKKERHQIYVTALLKGAELGTLYAFPYLKFTVRIVSSRDFPKWRACLQATSHLKTDMLAPRLRTGLLFFFAKLLQEKPKKAIFLVWSRNPLLYHKVVVFSRAGWELDRF